MKAQMLIFMLLCLVALNLVLIRAEDYDDDNDDDDDLVDFEDDEYDEEDYEDEWDEDYPEDEEETICVDYRKECESWAARGECIHNPTHMNLHCRKSCNQCAVDTNSENMQPQQQHEQLQYHQGVDMGVPQTLLFDDGTFAEDILYLISKARNYMKNHNMLVPSKFDHNEGLHANCKNQHELCAFWALNGKCKTNKEYMLKQCGPMCNNCHSSEY